jgi:hypothetical protein
MSATKECTNCHKVKPLTDFPEEKRRKDGRGSHCKVCRAEAQAGRRADVPAETKADAQAAYRAGIKKGVCAVCGTSIKGAGLCDTCEECVEVLGGLEGLKKAVSAVRYLTTRAQG